MNTGLSIASKVGILSKRGNVHTMKYLIGLSLLLAACFAPAVTYADAATYKMSGRAKFISDAPLETMEGNTNKVTGTLDLDPADITVTKGKFKVAVTSLRTGNDLRDEHLQGDGWLDAEKNPFLHFEITEVMPGKKGNKALKQGKDAKVAVKGRFTAHGITKDVVAKGTANWSGDAVRIKADFPVVLTDHNISVPSIVRLKVANEIAVSVDLKGTAK
jgi:polyisoprenoid-binding protein YceI